jgi:hypothetical protein
MKKDVVMLSPNEFRTTVVDVHVARFEMSLNSVADAFAVIWAIDAYASHVAKNVGQNEKEFKANLQTAGAWQFRIIREASNATKHAIVRNSTKRDVPTSSAASGSETMGGMSAWASRTTHWVEQIIIDINWSFDGPTQKWVDGKEFSIVGKGPLFHPVTVFDLIEPSLMSIDDRLHP